MAIGNAAKLYVGASPYILTSYDNIDIVITNARFKDNQLIVQVDGYRDGVEIPLDNPFVFVNPPLLVPDPDGPIVLDSGNYREDWAAVVETIVIQAVKYVLTNRD